MKNSTPKSQTGRLIGLGIVLTLMLVAVWTLPIEAWLQQAQAWSVEHPWLGRSAYLAAFVVAACLMVPGSLLFMSGGYLFGFVWGGLLAVLATPLAALAAYWVGATIAREPVAALVSRNPKFDAIDRAIDRKGGLIVLLTRLSMLLPYNVLNYAFSVTRVRPGAYFWATALGMLPPVILFVYIGAAASDVTALTEGDQVSGPWSKVILVGGIIVLIAALVVIQRTASRILRESIAEAEDEEAQS